MLNFQDSPDEVILKILSYAEAIDLINCGQVSKKIRRISQDGTLWATVNLEKKIVKTELIEMILKKGCEVLNLRQSTILGSLSSISRSGLRRRLLIPKSQLRVLKLSRPECNTNCNCDTDTYSDTDIDCNENTGVLEDLLLVCSSLQYLEMEDVLLTTTMAKSICKNGKTLQILNLNSSDLQSSHSKYLQIFRSCQELKEINLANVNQGDGIKVMDLVFLAGNIAPNVEKLNLSSIPHDPLFIKQILLRRCNKLKALSIEATWITDCSLKYIRHCLSHTLEELSLGHCDNISFNGFLELKPMPKLKILNLYYNKKDGGEEIQYLTKHLPYVKIKVFHVPVKSFLSGPVTMR